MSFFSLLRGACNDSSAEDRTGKRRRPRSPWAPLLRSCERLEARVMPATRTWVGLGADANWSTAQNWAGAVAPAVDDNLVFPAGAARLTNVNDFAAGTRFRSVTISDPGYVISELSPGA